MKIQDSSLLKLGVEHIPTLESVEQNRTCVEHFIGTLQERFVIGPFGDSNVCGQYIESVMKQSNILNCPTCGKRIENVIRVHQM